MARVRRACGVRAIPDLFSDSPVRNLRFIDSSVRRLYSA